MKQNCMMLFFAVTGQCRPVLKFEFNLLKENRCAMT